MGKLAVLVSGLPTGTEAAVRVAGPDGYAQAVRATQTLVALTPGAYTVAAEAVTVGNDGYAPNPPAETIAVPSGNTPVSVAIQYVLAIGKIAVTVTGLPSEANADVEITGPGFHRTLTGNGVIGNLPPGEYTVTAASVTVGTKLYNPTPATQTVQVGTDGMPIPASIRYRASATGGFNLAIDGMYLVQSTQTYRGAIPLLAGRQALLRIFVLANHASTERPAVRVRLYQNGALSTTSIIPASALSVPTQVEEGSLSSSWNLVIPADRVRPGLAIAADLDPDDEVAEGNEEDNTYPASGNPFVPVVRSSPTLQVRLVPVFQLATGRTGAVFDGNRDAFLATTRSLHPVVNVQTDVRPAYTTSVGELDPSDDERWTQVLAEINALRLIDVDAAGWHYYGIVSTAYGSGIAGLGYVAGRSAIGWDYLPSGANVAAHELGHNWGRLHAPCGNVSRPDVQYPYSGGTIGTYGFDFSTGTVKPSSYTDLMGYCGAQWVSDYTYLGVLGYRESEAIATQARAAVMPAPVTSAPVPGVLVWGRIVDGEPILEPLFEVVAPPSLPKESGPYTVEGRGTDGARIFALSFAAERIADAKRGDEHFAFVVPLSVARAAGLATLRLSTQRRSVTASAAKPDGPRFRVGTGTGDAAANRVAGGRVALRWNAAVHPMIMVRDPGSGRVLSFARGGSAEVAGDADEIELVASDRVHSQRVRVKVGR